MTKLSPTAPSINPVDLRPIGRAKWMTLLGLGALSIGSIVLLIGLFVVLPHVQAVAYLTLAGHDPHWLINRANWRQGGSTTVVMSRNNWRSGDYVKDEELLALLKLHRVETVDFAGAAPRSDEGVKTLVKLQHLKTLHLGRRTNAIWRFGPLMNDTALAELGKLTSLTTLSLDGQGVTDAGLVHIAKLENLEYLDLSENFITDAGLEHLSKLKNLKKLYLEVNNITPAAITKLQNTMPSTTSIDAGPIRDRSTGTLQN